MTHRNTSNELNNNNNNNNVNFNICNGVVQQPEQPATPHYMLDEIGQSLYVSTEFSSTPSPLLDESALPQFLPLLDESALPQLSPQNQRLQEGIFEQNGYANLNMLFNSNAQFGNVVTQQNMDDIYPHTFNSPSTTAEFNNISRPFVSPRVPSTVPIYSRYYQQGSPAFTMPQGALSSQNTFPNHQQTTLTNTSSSEMFGSFPIQTTYGNTNSVVMHNSVVQMPDRAQQHQPKLRPEPSTIIDSKPDLGSLNGGMARNDANIVDQLNGDDVFTNTVSTTPLKGKYDFTVKTVDENIGQKWVYSDITKKLYCNPDKYIPLTLFMNEWVTNASLIITPRYIDPSEFQNPVKTCINCQNNLGSCQKEHIVHVIDNLTPNYAKINNHFSVITSVKRPAMGETQMTLPIKIMCSTVHYGGPQRRPFCLVFLLMVNNQFVGRQVINVQSCACPRRDMSNEVEKLTRSATEKRKTSTDEPQQNSRKRKIVKTTTTTTTTATTDTIKTESDDESKYTLLDVNKKYVQEIRNYIKYLKYSKKRNNGGLSSTDESD